MAETTIQWADYTFNPWVGCQRVSPGCEHCYAEAYDKRVGGVPKSQRDPEDPDHPLSQPLLRWGPKAPRVRTSVSNWKKPLKWDAEAEAAGARKRVFCASLADVFEDRAELVPWREDLFGLIKWTPHLDWLLLTKRPENIARLWPERWCSPDDSTVLPAWGPSAQRWPNVWLGTTVEDQRRADERIPHLIAVPAVVRFLSCEPLLGPLDLSRWMDEDKLGFVDSEIDWVIIGGESGGGARPFDLAWARSLVRECRDGGRSTEPRPFVKQLGARPFDSALPEVAVARSRLFLDDPHGGDMAEWPMDLRVREFPEVRRG